MSSLPKIDFFVLKSPLFIFIHFSSTGQPTNEENTDEISTLKEALQSSKEEVKHLNQELEMLKNSPATAEEHIIESSDYVVESPMDSASDFELIENEAANNGMDVISVKQELGSDNISELKVLIDRLQQEKQDLMHQRDQAIVSEGKTSASLESLKQELSSLGIVTMELMKEVEQSQGVDKEKSIEIESLKKICQFKGDGNKDEVVKLKDMLAGWHNWKCRNKNILVIYTVCKLCIYVALTSCTKF